LHCFAYGACYVYVPQYTEHTNTINNDDGGDDDGNWRRLVRAWKRWGQLLADQSLDAVHRWVEVPMRGRIVRAVCIEAFRKGVVVRAFNRWRRWSCAWVYMGLVVRR
jgi:hypothetical protein